MPSVTGQHRSTTSRRIGEPVFLQSEKPSEDFRGAISLIAADTLNQVNLFLRTSQRG